MENYPFVSVLMPVRNDSAFIARSLRAVLAQDYARDRMEVVVADGLSTDGTREIVREICRVHSNVTLIDNPGKTVSIGLNDALTIAKGDVIIRVDGHCEIANDYVSRCVESLSQDEVDCVGGPLQTVGESYRAQAIAAAMSSTFGVGGSAFRVGSNSTRPTDTVPFPAYKRETIQRAGPFDEELVRNQDDEYNYRLRKLGGNILLSPDIRSRYYSRATLLKLWKQYFQYGYWKVRVMQKHPRQMRARQFAPPMFAAVLALLLLSAPFFSVSKMFLAATVLAYLMLAAVAAIFAAHRASWVLLPLVPIAFSIIHLAYGLGFLFGLARFWNRWGRHQVLTMRDESQPQRVGIS